MKNLFVILILSVLFACNSSKSDDSKNIVNENLISLGEISYEVDFYSNPDFVKGFNNPKVVQYLVNSALSGKIEVYSYFFNEKLDSIQLKSIFNISVDTVFVENPETKENEMIISKTEFEQSEIKSLLFTEDWYLDTETNEIIKKIKSFGPVRYYTKEGSDELFKSVLFMTYPDKEFLKTLLASV